MYVHPFICGMAFMFLLEAVIVIGIVIHLNAKNNKKERENEATDNTNTESR